ncbi:MAG TPA: TldD/PmbA family protein [Candidatus Limnocylindria bacterium]|nr:TldD/PmbA family protein [Candidatus Limnocylindria bacterium]
MVTPVEPVAPGRDQVTSVLEAALAASRAEATEVVYVGSDDALTRFANNQVHQNVREHDTHLQVRVIDGGRLGVASTNRLDEDAIRDVVARAGAIAERAAPNPKLGPLPGPNTREAERDVGYVSATAEASPDRRAEGARAVIAAGAAENLIVSGSYATGTLAVAVANSSGLRAEHRTTHARLLTVMMDRLGGDAASGYANAASPDVSRIDAAAVGAEAADKAARSRGAIELEAGDYEVVLEEYAVATVLDYLGFIGFGALALEEGRSFMELGRRVMGENVSIWDDGTDPAGVPTPIDFEGVVKARVDLVRGGIATAVVHDSSTAHRAGTASTGHALPAPNLWGPLPTNLFMAGGDAPRSDLAAPIERGLWVTRFHYVNPVHAKRAILTGMTKDGTFLIENGRLTRPVLNLRFTQSIPEAFSEITAISRETRIVPSEYFGASRVPAVRVGRFSFTGVTAREGSG